MIIFEKNFLLVAIGLMSNVLADDDFDVVSISNVPFPSSSHVAASLSAPFDQDIPEFTFCYRFMITTYNKPWTMMFRAKDKKNPNTGSNSRYLAEWIGFETGYEYAGFQFTSNYLYRNVPGDGIGGLRHPLFVLGNLPQFVSPGKWFHACSAYSSLLHRRHIYYNGMKVVGFTYPDDVEGPMPADTFEDVVFGMNLRGFYTDINIYARFFTENEMILWTSS